MFDYESIEIIKFSGDYVNGIAKDVLLDFSINSYVIKGSTGIGATTAILNNLKGNYIIISPNVGMIMKKENPKGPYASDKQLFIYGNSNNSWKEVEIYFKETETDSQNLIINTTPEQILKIKSMNPTLYEQLKKMFVFVDEINAYAQGTSYRNSLGEFMELIYNEWGATFKISTATPVPFFIDIPKDIAIKYYKLEHKNEELRPLKISNNTKHALEFIMDELQKKHLVVVFTNNINYHKKFKPYRVANFVGKNLKIKLASHNRGQLDVNVNPKDYDIILLSSSYFSGFDLEVNCSICVISEQNNCAYKINILDFVQAYGRCRHNVLDALYINSTAEKDRKGKPIYTPKTFDEVDDVIMEYERDLKYYQSKVDRVTSYYELSNKEFITPSLYVNRLLLLTDTLEKVNDFHQYNPSVFSETLQEYNFVMSDFKPTKTLIKKEKSTTFKERMANLMKLSEQNLYRNYLDIIQGLKYKDDGAFNSGLALEHLTAYLSKKIDDPRIHYKLNKNRVKTNEFYDFLNLFLRANVDTSYYYPQVEPVPKYQDEKVRKILFALKRETDDWQYLYGMYCAKKRSMPQDILHVMKLYEEAHNLDLYKEHQEDISHRVENVERAISSHFKNALNPLNNTESIWLNKRVKDIYKDLDKNKFVYRITVDYLKLSIVNSIGYLLTQGRGNYKSKEVKNREYHDLVWLPKPLRCMIPLKYISIDLDSANAQIVDDILGSKIGLNVYQNLMENRNLTREKAKDLFNKTLNRNYLSIGDASTVYLDCGYNKDEAIRLAEMTTKVKKGEFYEVMTKREKKLINNYKEVVSPSVKCFRLHDALIVDLESIECNHITLPEVVKGFKYHFNIFNDDSHYEVLITDIPLYPDELIDNNVLMAS